MAKFDTVKEALEFEKVVRESGDKLSEEDKTRLEDATNKAKETYKTASDTETLKGAIDELSKVSNEIFTKLYQNANPQGGADVSPGAGRYACQGE